MRIVRLTKPIEHSHTDLRATKLENEASWAKATFKKAVSAFQGDCKSKAQVCVTYAMHETQRNHENRLEVGQPFRQSGRDNAAFEYGVLVDSPRWGMIIIGL